LEGKWNASVLNLVGGSELTLQFDIVYVFNSIILFNAITTIPIIYYLESHVSPNRISAVGVTRTPDFPAQFEPFKGVKMHTAKWNPDVDLENKTVAIVGTGASAVQVIPEIVDKVKELIVYQRCALPLYFQLDCWESLNFYTFLIFYV